MYYINICNLHHFPPSYLALDCCMWPLLVLLLISSAVCTALGRAGYLVQCQRGGAGIISITLLGWNYFYNFIGLDVFL